MVIDDEDERYDIMWGNGAHLGWLSGGKAMYLRVNIRARFSCSSSSFCSG